MPIHEHDDPAQPQVCRIFGTRDLSQPHEQARANTMGGSLLMMALAAMSGSLLTVATYFSVTRTDRIVFASIGAASLLLSVCLLNNSGPGPHGAGLSANQAAAFYQDGRHASRLTWLNYAVGNFQQLVSMMSGNG